jgi:rhamnose utilization protein RhaD (predicted bifunctional aldolase and dehydrogenase)
MEAVRKKLTRKGKQVIIDLPDHFKSEKVEVIILPASEEEVEMTPEKLAAWKEDLAQYYSTFKADLSNFKFNREKLYDRP